MSKAPAAPRLTSVLVWGVWGALLLVLLGSIARDGRNLPRAEDWYLVPLLTGHETVTLDWLWKQNNEHRVPIPRLIYSAVLKTSGLDFRAGMVFNTLLAAAVAAAMVHVAARVRGGPTWTDATFSLLLLHLGHWDNLLWGWQIQFVLSTVFASVLLLVIVAGGEWSWPRAGLTAAALVALPLCGANGLAFAPLLGAWAAASAVAEWRHSRAGAALLVVAAAAVAFLLTVLYFVDYERPPWNPDSPGMTTTVATAAKAIAMGFGPAAGASWTTSVAGVTVLLALAGAVLLWTGWTCAGRERWRALGLLAFLLSGLVLAGGVGLGRAGRVAETGRFSARYAFLTAPLIATVYFVWLLYGPRRWRAGVLGGVAVTTALLLPENTLRGLSTRSWHLQGMQAVVRDIEAGMPRQLLAERHQPFLLHWDRERLGTGMAQLREAGRGPFARLREGRVHDVPLWSVDPGGAWSSCGDKRVVSVPGTPRVYAIRLRLNTGPCDAGTGRHLQVAWAGPDGAGEETVALPESATAAADTATVWINAPVESIRIGGPGIGRIGVLSVVVPAPESGSAHHGSCSTSREGRTATMAAERIPLPVATPDCVAMEES